jgi:tRNA threonylcarbamoyladenosine biosynthesis protein TsaB
LRILAFDTTSPLGSIALHESGQLLEEVTIESPDGFSPVIFGAIQGLLERHHWKVDSIDAFASAAGPGSFTGVRVSLAAAKGLAEAAGKPVIGVSNLQAGAVLGSGPVRAPWIDARRGEVYGGLYSAALDKLAEERVLPFDAWRSSLPPDAEIVACGGRPLAAAIAAIAAKRLLRGDVPPAEALDANYLRRSDAELFWKDPATS